MTLPIPAIAVLIVGGCLAGASTLYTGYKLYQHGLGFFNTKSTITPESLVLPSI